MCDDFWDSADARVVCKQLGYPSSGAIAFSYAYFGSGYGPIWLDNVYCTGSESNLVNCTNNGIGIHNCGHHEDAGVRCSDSSNFSSVTPSPTPTPFGKSFSAILVSKCMFSVCNSGSVRLVNGSTHFVNGSNVYESRVELCLNNQWGTVIVCDDSLDSYDAQVVCRQLGYSANGAVAFTYPYFGNGFRFEEVNCSGSELNVLFCSANFTDQCVQQEAVGVRCINSFSSLIPSPTETPNGKSKHTTY